ncbi:MAG: hypothetical protein AAB482_02300 [Patescibacteria group bacterium]
MNKYSPTEFTISIDTTKRFVAFCERNAIYVLSIVLSCISVVAFTAYYFNGFGLAYNDARSHLDIGRRVVEGLKPGLAQLGSVWLPLTHILMIPTIWNDFMWHTGLAGALQSMIAYVATGLLIYLFLRELGASMFARLVGVAIFASNTNILYLQSTAMTELLLLATMTAGAYQLLLWFKSNDMVYLIKSSFWIMLSTLVRYDGWFLFGFAAILIFSYTLYRKGYAPAEGTVVLYATLAGFGIALWFLWNALIFKDPLYFIFGPYSAYSQQNQLEAAGVLATKGDWFLSLKFYVYALAYNSGAFTMFLGLAGAFVMWFNRRENIRVRVASVVLIAPFLFNVIALYLGHSVLFIQGLSGDTWFNIRYGVMMMPSLAIFIGYLVDRVRLVRGLVVGLLIFVMFFSITSSDTVTIDDARVGSSQKNVTEVSSWLTDHAKNEKGFILISAASHDAIIFSSGLPMKKFIHEGTGAYWTSATRSPDRWARWIIMRTYSEDDSTWRLVSKSPGFERYNLVGMYPFADIYELKPEFMADLQTEPVLGKQK